MPSGASWRVLVVKNEYPRRGRPPRVQWTLSKGHFEKGTDASKRHTAERELFEEAGLHVLRYLPPPAGHLPEVGSPPAERADGSVPGDNPPHVNAYPNQGKTKTVYFNVAEVTGWPYTAAGLPTVHPLDGEVVEWRWIPVVQVIGPQGASILSYEDERDWLRGVLANYFSI